MTPDTMDGRARKLVLVLQVVATVALAPLTLLALPTGLVLTMASDACPPFDQGESPPLICTANGQLLVGFLPASSSLVGLIVAGLGWALPARYRGWVGLLLGYSIAIAGWLTSWVIASGAEA